MDNGATSTVALFLWILLCDIVLASNVFHHTGHQLIISWPLQEALYPSEMK